MIAGGMEEFLLIVDSIVNWFFQTILRKYLAMRLKVAKDFMENYDFRKSSTKYETMFSGIVGILAEA